MPATHEVTITISERTLEAALACLDACATDETEPQRYQDWYAESAQEIREAMK